MKQVDYSGGTPPDYKCGKCGKAGIKLWRESHTFSPDLRCAVCAAADQDENISDIDSEGKTTCTYGGRSDQIGRYVPAVPDEEGVGYWGYTSVPWRGVIWWRQLPTLAKEA